MDDPRVAFLVLTGLVALFVGAFLALTGAFPDDSRFWRLFALGWLVAALASVPAVALLIYLDRRDPEPWWAGSLAYFWGAVVATELSLVIRTAVMTPLSRSFDQSARHFETTAVGVRVVDRSAIFESLENVLTAPFVEEAIKSAALLILVALLPSLIGGVRDGIVYGALVGLGFAVAETASYIGSWYANAGFSPFMGQLVPRFVFGGINGHAVYSALFGASLGLAIEVEKGRWARKTLLIVGGLLLAVSAHAMSNAFGPFALVMLVSVFGIDPGLLSVGELWWLSAAKVLMTTAWAYLILAYLIGRSGKTELEVIKGELMEEAEPTVLVAELPLIEEEGIWRLRRVPWLTRRVSVRVVRAQNRVAFRRHYLSRQGRSSAGDAALEDLRATIVSIRAEGGNCDGGSGFGE